MSQSLGEEGQGNLILGPLLDIVRIMAPYGEVALLTTGLAPQTTLDADRLPVAEGIGGVHGAIRARVALAYEVVFRVVGVVDVALVARTAEPAVLDVV